MGFSDDPIHAHASQEAHYSCSTESQYASSERMATTGGRSLTARQSERRMRSLRWACVTNAKAHLNMCTVCQEIIAAFQ